MPTPALVVNFGLYTVNVRYSVQPRHHWLGVWRIAAGQFDRADVQGFASDVQDDDGFDPGLCGRSADRIFCHSRDACHDRVVLPVY